MFSLLRLSCFYLSRRKVLILFFLQIWECQYHFLRNSGGWGVMMDNEVNCCSLLQPSTELHHRAVVTSATLKHKWTIRLEKWFKVQEQAVRLECQTEMEEWSVSTGWVKELLESENTIWYQWFLQNKTSYSYHVKCSSIDLIPQKRGSFYISLMEVYFHNAMVVSP